MEGLLDLTSRSSKSLQNKNTKKLSLDISSKGRGSSHNGNKVVMIEKPRSRAFSGNGSTMCSSLSSFSSLGSSSGCRSHDDAQIYTLPTWSPGTSGEAIQSGPTAGALKLTIETGVSSTIGGGRLRHKKVFPGAGSSTRSWVFHYPDGVEEKGDVEEGDNDEGLCDNESAGSSSSASTSGLIYTNPSMKHHMDALNGKLYVGEPVCVVVPGIFLYNEPTFEQVKQFDVVFNVAKEVTGFHDQILEQGTATEYHHYKWSHTTKISKDLEILTGLMHDAVVEGKSVLVHCQCGVSRSASLIVAYIMRYENLSLNDAYNRLKNVAENISPNMNLIFQLMEWGDKLQLGSIDTDESGISKPYSPGTTTPPTPGDFVAPEHTIPESQASKISSVTTPDTSSETHSCCIVPC